MKKTLLSLLFILAISQHSFGQCAGAQTLTATPAPSPLGTYQVGTVVTFCYSVSDYSQNGADWIAGVVPTIGPAWDASSLTPVTIPPSCDGQGTWDWYLSCTGTASGQTWGPGFFYDSPAGSPGGTADGIPGNNYGDNCPNNTWTFCFSLTVGQCIPSGSSSLFVGVTPLSDYSAGSWTTNACIDPVFAYGVINCVDACALTVPNVTIVDATCSNTNNGSITVFPNGVSPYTYLWSNGSVSQTNSNLAPGIYTVTVTDSIGCEKVVTFPVGGPSAIALNETVVDNGCNSTGGSITLAPTGGTGTGYTFLWNDGTSGSSLNNLAGGTYTVTVTDTNNCTQTGTFTISTVDPLITSASATNTSCGGSDGSASVVVTGGVAPYTYDWQPAGGTGSSASNLPAGTYTVTITDGNGCTATAQATVLSIGQFTLTSTFVPLGCDPLGTTTATVTPNGGTAPFTYNWTPSGGNQPTATGLASGTYIVYVTDANSCIDSATVIIPGVIPVTLSSATTPVQCNQPNSGTATTTPGGGTAPYNYNWSSGASGSTASNLAGGTYTVTVTDANGCSATDVVIVNVIPDVTVTAGTDQTVCNGTAANISATANGGSAPFNYSWSNGNGNQSQSVTPTATTTYTVIVIDANLCSASSSVIVNVIDYPVVTVSSNTSICYNSSTGLQAGGGSTYSWSPVDGLSDPNIANPNASPTQTTTYTVTVSNGQCSATGTVTVDVAPQIFGAFTPSITNGQAPLTVNFDNTTGGAVSYEWAFGDGGLSTVEDPSHTYNSMGNYEVVLVSTNSIGCTDTVRYSFIVVDSESSLVIPNIFTPNGDNYNDLFDFEEIGIASIDVLILNRWGREVFAWNKTNGGWDGKSKDGSEVPEGTYIYVVKARGINSKAYNFEGTVELIRNKD